MKKRIMEFREKRVSYFILFLSLVLSGLANISYAQTSTVPSGSGTSGDPYQIATLNNLYWLTQTTAAWASGKYFIQTANIDASSTSTWSSGQGFSKIGNNTTNFKGNYNGGGYKIDGLYINRASDYYTGLFGYTQGATITNLGVTNVNITSMGYIGAVVGYANTGTGISYCYATGTVTGTSYGSCGVFVGQNTGTISFCYVTSGSVNGTGSSWGVGGFVGVNYSGGAINYCFSNCNATSANQQGAGFVGRNGLNGSATISNCYCTGNAKGSTYSGGFCGSNTGGSITNCYSTSLFTYTGSGSNYGGFCGSNSAEITNCFWDTQTSGVATSYGGTGKTTAQMRTQSTFTDATWNFTTIWNMNAIYNSGYPILIGFTYSPDPNTWSGAISTDWNNTGNWSYNSLPTSADNITIPNVTNKPVIETGNTGSAKNITINTGSSLTVNGTLDLAGSLTNNGAVTTSSGTLNFIGASAQNTTGFSGNYGSLVINNANGITLTNNASVSGTLTLTDGLLNLGSYNLTLGASATIGGIPTASNMIVATGTGELRKIYSATGSFIFPVGDNTETAEFSPISLNFTGGTFSSAYAGVTLSNSKYSNNTSSVDYLNRYWTVTQSGISNFTCDVTAQYLPADITGSEANIYCGKYDAGLGWTLLNQANSVNHTIAGTVTGFSTFTGGQQSSMPVKLLTLNSNVISRDIRLQWTTSSETNNAGFEIQRLSSDNQNSDWNKIGYVKGNGTKNTASEYNFTDSKLNKGKYQYRLKQIDNNGNFEYHSLNNIVEIGVPNKFSLSQNYPNPFNPTTKIDFQIPYDAKVTLLIYDISGRQIATLLNNEFKKADFYSIDFNASNLSSGVYFYKIIADKFSDTKKGILLK